MADQRTYTGGRFMMDVGGYNVGFLKKFSGFAMEADIVANDLGPDVVQKKHVANIKWTAGKATVGVGMGKAMYDWIKLSFDKGQVPKDGAVTSANFDYKAQSVVEFKGAIITGVTVPKMDGSSKDAAYLDVEFDPEMCRWKKGGGEVLQAPYGSKQKAWLCSMFRFEMGKLPCDRVASVDSFTWKCAVAQDQIGIVREPTKHAAKVTVPDVKIAASMADYQQWADAAKSWFVDGNHLEKDELDGALIFLGPDMKLENGRINLKNCGFKKFSKEDSEANSEKIARFNVEFYVEQMQFEMKNTDA